MEYTKKDLLRMKKKLYELVQLERRYEIFVLYTKIGTTLGVTGSAVSLCMYLNKLASIEKALTVGGACLVTSGICSLAGYSVGKERKNISNELEKFEMKCPGEVLDEVYESVYKR